MSGVPVPLYEHAAARSWRYLNGRGYRAGVAFCCSYTGTVLHCAGGQIELARAGDFPSDALRDGRQADQGLEVPLNEEGDGER